ncbi:uncharacterized protein BO80DRAFT_449638 [Aspergillus ibericus CBS 121593]|uniref:Uncharacterized protein n=1 Tax=Aspergillus ibericus CBS 121593 TaxID=1448316 RepID=A0A395GKL7_9EURO|nr:hypothetical protein BO80DRAFT_449638 [Aspergillus ibericus CBS 121593]RAK96041.1 hypothetical protein BO80DRAFT_449638 [Aspergillus ibericus CBS 121593]
MFPEGHSQRRSFSTVSSQRCIRDIKSYFTAQTSVPHYTELYKDTELYKEIQLEDEPIEKTRKAEHDYFRNLAFRLAMARKLTLVSQWKLQYTHCSLRSEGELFVTDSRLWKWIMEFMQQWETIYQ